MSGLVRTVGVFFIGLAGFLVWSASPASAEITDPSQPWAGTAENKAIRYAPATPPPDEAAEPSPTPSSQPARAEVPQSPGAAETGLAAPAPSAAELSTPAPETVVTRASPHRMAREAPDPRSLGPVGRVVQNIREGFDDLGVFLDQVAGACKVGVASGTGVPVLVLAVLSMATALTRHRVLGTRWPGDEEPPELLYAWDVIAPG